MSEAGYAVEMTPGSQAAGKAGCTCPVLDNCYGKGFKTDASGQPMYWMSTSCPIHGDRKDNASQITPGRQAHRAVEAAVGHD